MVTSKVNFGNNNYVIYTYIKKIVDLQKISLN